MSKAFIRIAQGLMLIVAIGLIALLVLPYWFGMQLRGEYETYIAQANASNAGMKIEPIAYHGGWFSSDAQSQISVRGLPFTLQINHHIIHGPLFFGHLGQDEPMLVTAVVKSDVRVNNVDKPDDASPAMAYVNTVMRMNKTMASVWRFNEQVLPTSGKPMWARIEASMADQHVGVQMQLPELQISQPGAKTHISDLRLDVNMKSGASGLMVGETLFSVDRMLLQGAEDDFDMGNWRMRVSSRERGTKLDVDFDVSLDTVSVSAGSAGPIRFAFQVNNLDAPTLLKIEQLQKSAGNAVANGADEQEAMMQVMPQMMALLPVLVSDIDLQMPHLLLMTEDGRIGGKASLKINGLDPAALQMPMMMLSALDLEAELFVSAGLLREQIEGNTRKRLAQSVAVGTGGPLRAEEIDEKAARETHKMLTTYTAQGYIALQDGLYRTRIRFKDGNLSLNGNALNLAQLMSP